MITFSEAVKFHGHSCPGLAMGFRMVTAALEALNVSHRACDEELVAIVENDACGVDAVQLVAGCSFGKGNLIFNDYGKPVYTIYHRPSGQAVRVAFTKKNIPAGLRDNRPAYLDWLLSVESSEIMHIELLEQSAPARARIYKSFPCEQCGEDVMETRLRNQKGKKVCIPCSKNSVS